MSNFTYTLKVLAVNVQGIECFGRSEQIQNLLVKHTVSVAVLTEMETSHSIAETTYLEGLKAFCHPFSVTGPPKKEVGVILMVSNQLASASKPIPEINGNDTVQSVWVEIVGHDLLIGGVYRHVLI